MATVFLTVRQAALRLGVSEADLNKWVFDLPHLQIVPGITRLFAVDYITAFAQFLGARRATRATAKAFWRTRNAQDITTRRQNELRYLLAGASTATSAWVMETFGIDEHMLARWQGAGIFRYAPDGGIPLAALRSAQSWRKPSR